jgi:SRSO17 transposase
MREPSAPLRDPALSTVHGGVIYLREIERRLAPSVERAEPRQRALTSVRGLLSPAERKPSWQLAEIRGDATPYAFPHLRRRARWDAEAVRDARRPYVVPHRGAVDAVLVLDETGFLNKGRHSAAVAHPDRGTAGTVDNGQSGVLLGDARALGHALLARERYLPAAWTDDRERCQDAGIPADRHCATKPQRARQLLARTFAAGVPAHWITGNRGDGHDRRRRLWLEAQPHA